MATLLEQLQLAGITNTSITITGEHAAALTRMVEQVKTITEAYHANGQVNMARISPLVSIHHQLEKF